MKIQIETSNQALAQKIDQLATRLHEIADERLSREAVAGLVIANGFAAHTGCHHIAIHRADYAGRIMGDRLAIVTHDFN